MPFSGPWLFDLGTMFSTLLVSKDHGRILGEVSLFTLDLVQAPSIMEVAFKRWLRFSSVFIWSPHNFILLQKMNALHDSQLASIQFI